MQWFNTRPEDCWTVIEKHADDDRLFELVFHWLVEELMDWSRRRSSGVQPAESYSAYSGNVRNALLSILTVMTEQKRDEFALLALNLEQKGQCLPSLLTEAVVYHGKCRARMSAITLLSRLPNVDANLVEDVMRAAMGDDAIVRDRALMLLPHFRDFSPTPAFLDRALHILKGNAPASVVLAYANLLTNLLSANQVPDGMKRREIMNALRQATSDCRNVRMLSHLSGTGEEKNPRQVVNDGRLDQALLAVMSKKYSSFFENV